MKVTIPTNWNDITIHQFNEMERVNKSKKDDFEKTLDIIGICTGMPDEDVLKLTAKDIVNINTKLEFLGNMGQLTDRKCSGVINVGNRRYLPMLNLNEYNGGQFIGVKAFQNVDKLHNFLAVICAQVKKKWLVFDDIQPTDPKEHDDHAEYILHNMSVGDAYPIFVFFCALYENLRSPLQDSINESVSELLKMIRTNRKKDKMQGKDG